MPIIEALNYRKNCIGSVIPKMNLEKQYFHLFEIKMLMDKF